MNTHRQMGTTLVVGLILLSLVTLLGLAGAGTVHVERQLAQDEQFRENAASAASAGIELSLGHIVITPAPVAVPSSASGFVPGVAQRFETVTRFAGYELALPQTAGSNLAGAHFEITSTGYSARRAVDRQRAEVMLVVNAPVSTRDATPASAQPRDCEPVAPGHCFELGQLVRLSWQRLAVE
jgi:hypothetical protein